MLRKALFVILFLVLVGSLLYYNGWDRLNLNSGIKTLLTEKLQAAVGENSFISRCSIGFHSINLGGVRLAFRNSPYELWIPELRLGYSLKSLLNGTLHPQKTAEEITIFRPRLTLRYDPAKRIASDVDLSLQLSDDAEQVYRAVLRDYDFIKRITISDGQIVILNTKTGEQTGIAKGINGWAYTDDKGKAWVRFAGHVFSTDRYNMVMYGQLDLARGGIDYVKVDLHDYEINDEIPFLLPKYLDVLSGVVNGQITVTERLQPTRGFNIEGGVTLNDGAVKVVSENLYLSDINIEAEIKDWSIAIKHASQKINGSPAELTGEIENLLDPHFNLHLASHQIDVKRFLDALQPESNLPFEGTAALDVSVTGPLQEPHISGCLTSPRLSAFHQTLDSLRIELNLTPEGLLFPNISGQLLGAKLTGDGRINLAAEDKSVDFKMALHGDVGDELRRYGFLPDDRCLADARFSVFGTLLNPVSTGEFDLNFGEDDRPSLRLNGSFNYNNSGLFLTSASDDGEFRFNASVEDIFHEPKFNLQGSRLEKLLNAMHNPVVDFVKKRYNFNLSAEGDRSQLTVKIDGFRRDNYQKFLQVSAKREPGATTPFEGEIVLFPNSPEKVSGDFDLEVSPDGYRLSRFELGDWLRGEFRENEVDSSGNVGKINISGFKLAKLLALLGIEKPTFDGDIYGQIRVARGEPLTEYVGNLWLLNGFLGELGPIKAELNLKANAENVEIEKLTIEDNDLLDFVATGNVNLKTKYIDAYLGGSNIDLNTLVDLVTGTSDVVQGKAMLNVSLRGKYPHLPLAGDIRVSNAKILMLNFDEIGFDLGEDVTHSTSYVGDGFLHFSSATLKRENGFTLRGYAELPLTGYREMDVNLAGDGNFLVMLSDLVELFGKSQSQGHLELHLRGDYTQPNFSGSKLQFTHGTLNLSSVVKRIDDLEGELAVLPDDYFLAVRKLQGKIQGQAFSITNTNDLTGLNHGSYEPLRVASDDLNLGAIFLSTESDGVPLNIPGLMDKGEIGWYAFQGRESDPHFFVAGPWERPVVRGKVKIRNANLMYPFDEGSGEGNPIVMNIMNNIDWDLVAVADNDTRYERQFATGIYVNMEVDKDSQLAFKGVLKDSTFRIAGDLQSTRGEVDYFDLNFRVEKFGAEFDPASLYPVVYGKAWTVVRDSSNVPSDVYLTLQTLDDKTNQEVKKGRWDRISIKLSSEHPKYEETQSDLMATLGYSANTIDKRARRAVGYSTDNFLFRPLLRPLERELERKLGLDVVRFSYAIAQNVLDSSFGSEQLQSSLAFLRSSRLVLGKYLTNDMYVLYTGEIKAGIDYQFQDKGVGLQHSVGLEYRLNSRWLFQMEYDYNTLLESHKDDKKVWLRHSFPF